MTKLMKTLIIFVLIAITYHLITCWLWYVIGWQWDTNHWQALGWITFITSGFVFPIWFANTASRVKPNDASGGWITRAFFICWLPLMVNLVLDRIVATYSSGFYTAEIMPIIGADQLWINYLILFLQWIWTTVLFCIVFFDLNQMLRKKNLSYIEK